MHILDFSNLDKNIALMKKTVADSTGNKSTKGFDTSDSKWIFKSMLKQNGNNIVNENAGKITPVFQEESAVEVAKFWQRLVDEKVKTVKEINAKIEKAMKEIKR